MATRPTAGAKVITRGELAELLAAEPVQFAAVWTRTKPRLIGKRNGPLAGRTVWRWAKRNGAIGASYERVVNRQRLREAAADGRPSVEHFRADRLWRGRGRHVAGNRHLVEHTESGRLYLVFFPRTDARGNAQLGEHHYRDGRGRWIARRDVEPHLRPGRGSDRQRTRKPIPWRLIALESILAVQLGGQIYTVDH